MQQIVDETGLDRAFAGPRFLLFKHSQVCPVSAHANRHVLAFEAAHADLPIGWIDVREHRDLARAVAEQTGIEHESPQVLLLEAGEVVWHASHYGITQDDLEGALA